MEVWKSAEQLASSSMDGTRRLVLCTIRPFRANHRFISRLPLTPSPPRLLPCLSF